MSSKVYGAIACVALGLSVGALMGTVSFHARMTDLDTRTASLERRVTVLEQEVAEAQWKKLTSVPSPDALLMQDDTADGGWRWVHTRPCDSGVLKSTNCVEIVK